MEPQTTVPPPPVVPMAPTPTNSKLPWILGGLALLILGGIGGVYLGKQLAYSSPVPIAAIPTTTSDQTADWTTYTSTSGDYSFKYPADYFKFHEETTPGYVYLAPSQGQGGNGIKFLEKTDLWLETSDQTPMDFDPGTVTTPVTIGGSTGQKLTISSPMVAGNLTKYTIVAWVNVNGILYSASISSWDETTLKNSEKLFDQILSTFKFTNTTVSQATPRPILSPQLLGTSDWKAGNVNSVSFKYPSDYSLEPYQDSVTLRKASTSPGGGHYISINTYSYDGGSRRQWYVDRLHTVGGDSLASIEKYTLAQEVMLGTVDALDFWMDNGWWQGGGTSPIIIAQGKTILTISDCCNRNHNFETGQSTRGTVSDTIGSTIRFN